MPEAAHSTRARVWRPALAGLLLVLAACSRTPPEEALRQELASLREAVQTRDADAIRKHLAADFIGPQGMDRDEAGRMATLSRMRYRSVGLTLGPLDLTVQGDHATARFTAALTGGSGRLLPDSARVYEVETGWRLQDGHWPLSSARWAPAIGGE